MYTKECFDYYGLNSYRNFMGEEIIYLKDEFELLDYIDDSLYYHCCDNCCLFIHLYNGEMVAAIKDENEIVQLVMASELNDSDFFKQVDADFRLCCYGLIIETWPGVFKVIER